MKQISDLHRHHRHRPHPPPLPLFFLYLQLHLEASFAGPCPWMAPSGDLHHPPPQASDPLRDLVAPAVNGTLNVLRAAAAAHPPSLPAPHIREGRAVGRRRDPPPTAVSFRLMVPRGSVPPSPQNSRSVVFLMSVSWLFAAIRQTPITGHHPPPPSVQLTGHPPKSPQRNGRFGALGRRLTLPSSTAPPHAGVCPLPLRPAGGPDFLHRRHHPPPGSAPAVGGEDWGGRVPLDGVVFRSLWIG